MAQIPQMRIRFRIFLFIFVYVAIVYAQSDHPAALVSSGSGLQKNDVTSSVKSSDETTVDTGNVSLTTVHQTKLKADTATTAMGSENRIKSPTGLSPAIDIQLSPAHKILFERDSVHGELFKALGGYHRLMGIYGVIGGALTILAGAILLDRTDAEPFAMSFLVVGGISVGLGLWEIKIGGKLSEYKAVTR